MKWTGISNQARYDYLYDASRLIASANAPALLLPRGMSRTYLFIQNLSNTATIFLEFDGPRATANLTNGVVTSLTPTNVGFNFTKPPVIRFEGGGNDLGGGKNVNRGYLGLGLPGGSSPSARAKATAKITGGALSGFDISTGGANYAVAPYVLIENDDLDPYGCALPTVGQGYQLNAGEKLEWNGSVCPTGPVAVITQDVNTFVTCKWMD